MNGTEEYAELVKRMAESVRRTYQLERKLRRTRDTRITLLVVGVIGLLLLLLLPFTFGLSALVMVFVGGVGWIVALAYQKWLEHRLESEEDLYVWLDARAYDK